MLKRGFLILCVALLSLTPASEAVVHINPGAYPNAKKDMVKHPSAASVRKFGSVHAATLGSSTGPKNIAVILVQFAPSSLISGSHLIVTPLANITARFDSMKAFYLENSYGALDLTFSYFGSNTIAPTGHTTAQAAGVLTSIRTEQYYGCGDEGDNACASVTTPVTGSVRANGDYLIKDALIALGVNKPTLATFDAVLVVHAGNGNETSPASGDIWSIFYQDVPGDLVITSAGAGFDSGVAIPDTEVGGTSPLGVMCHEFGHELSLPDLYNTFAGTSVVGKWELMDFGPYAGTGSTPSHLGAWAKKFLGWATPQIASAGGTVSIGYTALNPTSGIAQINLPSGSSQEYFLVEYRRPLSGALYDTALPGEGLLIWHIDDSIALTRGVTATGGSQNTVNTGSPHYGVSIVTADGNAAAPGTSGNPFQNGQNFISPRSNNFANEPSGVTIRNISGGGTSAVTFTVTTSSVTAGAVISKVINYPNPAGKGYPHPRSEGYTTIQFQLTRPAEDYSINIYTLSGDLVRKVPRTEIVTDCYGRRDSTACESDFKFVYEYDWDLKNGNGLHVAPGTYLYLIRADGESKTGKAVIIR